MKLTIVGGCGAWPAAGQACSGYLISHEGFQLFVDPGYATVPLLLDFLPAQQVDAVLVTHGHPDHCADLNPLLRARALPDDPPDALPLYALPNALDAVLALDGPGAMRTAYELHEFEAGDSFAVGPFEVATRLLPHFVPNAGVRLTAGDRTLTYTGDTGPSPDIVELARGADLLLAEATHVEQVPERAAKYLSSAKQAGRDATKADVGRLALTHLWPGTDQNAARAAAAKAFGGPILVASGGVVVDLA